MPDILKMKELVETLDNTTNVIKEMATRLEESMNRMTATLEKTQETIKDMSNAVKELADKTSSSIDRMSENFDNLISILLVLSKDFKNPLDPKSLLSTARELRDSLIPDFLKRG